MAKEIDLRAKLVLVTEYLEAHEGQYLIVFGDVCHGVYTGKIMPEHAALPKPAEPQRLLSGPVDEPVGTPEERKRARDRASKAKRLKALKDAKAEAKAQAKADLQAEKARLKAQTTKALKTAAKPAKSAKPAKAYAGITEAQVIAAMHKYRKPVTAMKLADVIGLPRGDAGARPRQQLSYAFSKLKAAGKVRYTDEKDGGFFKLILVDSGAAKPGPRAVGADAIAAATAAIAVTHEALGATPDEAAATPEPVDFDSPEESPDLFAGQEDSEAA